MTEHEDALQILRRLAVKLSLLKLLKKKLDANKKEPHNMAFTNSLKHQWQKNKYSIGLGFLILIGPMLISFLMIGRGGYIREFGSFIMLALYWTALWGIFEVLKLRKEIRELKRRIPTSADKFSSDDNIVSTIYDGLPNSKDGSP